MSTDWGMTADRGDDWRDRAACRDEDPERFFPTDLQTNGPQTVEAKAFCRLFCQVQDECLAWALGKGEDWGIWGGLTPAERRALTGRQREPKPSRPRTVCGNGHALEGGNVRIEYGKQVCKTCHANNMRRSRARRRAQRQAVTHVR